jgi:hypothetical protein
VLERMLLLKLLELKAAVVGKIQHLVSLANSVKLLLMRSWSVLQ